MGKPIEEHLADYLLGMNKASRTKEFMSRNLSAIKETYGERVARRVMELIRGKWKA